MKLVRSGNGALPRWIKHGSGVPEHVGFAVKDCAGSLQPLEVKAGMNLLTLKRRCGERVVLIGGMDERVLESSGLPAGAAELLGKLPRALAGSGYVLRVDRSVSPLVGYATYRYFVERGHGPHSL